MLCSIVLDCAYYQSRTGGAVGMLYVLDDANHPQDAEGFVTQKNKDEGAT